MPEEDEPSASASPGGRLRAALTDDQIQVLLDVVAGAGHLRAVDERLRAADPDLADTVRRMMDEPRTQSGAAPSSQKTIEIWNDLWGAWADHVAEVGEEKGRYVNHEEHWYPPYFDQTALANDLEEVAEQLSEWIDRAFPLLKEPDLFLDSLAEINQNVQSFPDWFQPVDEAFALGPRASSCVLRWTWLGLTNQSEPGRKLVDFLCSLEVAGQRTELDRDVCCQFVAGLPEGVCQDRHQSFPRVKRKNAPAVIFSFGRFALSAATIIWPRDFVESRSADAHVRELFPRPRGLADVGVRAPGATQPFPRDSKRSGMIRHTASQSLKL